MYLRRFRTLEQQGLHMSYSCSDIAVSKFDTAALQYHFSQHSEKHFKLLFWQSGHMVLTL